MSDFLSELNPSQRAAVEYLTGPLLILAGAGSGKTRALTYRIANLVLQGEATPHEILAVTFTNKAAREMEERVLSLLNRMNIPVYDQLWVSTFHSSCVRILREDIHLLGYQPFFVIYDDGDQLQLLKKICDDLKLNEKIYTPKQLRNQISNAKMLGLKPHDVSKKSFVVMDDAAIEVYQTYEDELKRSNALDFDDLLLKTYELLKKFPDVLKKYRERFKFIMVDEYQDTNHIQYLLIKLLAEEHRNLCVVGDEDQSIYSWRGADIRNILDFEKDFKEAKIIKLEENYRSTKNIVDAATHVIKNNTERKDKTLFTQNEPGSKIILQTEANEYDEARYVARKIQDLRQKNYSYNDMAIFYRTNAQSRVLEEQLRTYSIPYRVIGAVRFYDRAEVKNVICYLRQILNPNDDVAFYRIINIPTRGIGKSTVETIMQYAFEHKRSAIDAAREIAEHRMVHSGACNKIFSFLALLERLRFSQAMRPSELYIRVLDETAYALRLREENTPESLGRLENLEELQNAIIQFEKERGEEATLQSFLEEMALISDLDQKAEIKDGVTLMTLHLSKGLEFKNVFIVGLEEGLFPSSQRMDESDPTAVEEERRLAYVGMTRARENLHLTHAKVRRVWGQEEYRPVSRFVTEIPDHFLTANKDRKKSAFLDKYRQKYTGPRESEPQHIPSYEDFSDEVFQSPEKRLTDFATGMRVRHPIFGVGSIFQVEGSGDGQKVSVLFQDRSLKKFMTKHARLEKV